MLSELDKRIFLSKEEVEKKRKEIQDKNPSKKGSTLYQFEDDRKESEIIQEQMYQMAQSMKEMA